MEAGDKPFVSSLIAVDVIVFSLVARGFNADAMLLLLQIYFNADGDAARCGNVLLTIRCRVVHIFHFDAFSAHHITVAAVTPFDMLDYKTWAAAAMQQLHRKGTPAHGSGR